MDLVKTGQFLSQLRREKNLTQQELGEKLGVSNKTVSRWETGNYLPPVEMLQQLSQLYGITINELLSGEPLTEAEYKEKAEENIKSALRVSAFTLKERTEFYKRKWRKEHRPGTIVVVLLLLAVAVCGVILDNGLQLIALVVLGCYGIYRRNEMMTYIEARAFDGSGQQ